MYDVNEVASLLKISKVTVYKKLKKLRELEPFIVLKDDKTYVLEEGLEVIKRSLQVTKEFRETSDNEVASDYNTEELMVNNELVTVLVEQLREKDSQINAKDIQISELHKLIENNQILLKQQQDKELKQLQLEHHFQEVDQRLLELRTKMEKSYEKKDKKSLFKRFIKI